MNRTLHLTSREFGDMEIWRRGDFYISKSPTLQITKFTSSLLAFLLIAIVIAGGELSAQKTDITGKWVFDVQTDQGSGSPTFTFKQEGEKLTGTYSGTFGESQLAGTVKGNAVKFSFKADAQGTPVEITYDGIVEKDTVKGKLDIAGLAQGTFTGKRQ